ncbi:hypothetical protein SLS60_009641 [Paraconiothyrium brasiliense]|uniref:Uncharacterized protein n=1 Tax=Paraconiothyrium brasiliense TaxID=300254 RepID=A0ABR3QUY4_9PLEO
MRLWASSAEAKHMLLTGAGPVVSSSRMAIYIKAVLALTVTSFILVILHPLSAAQKYNQKHNLIPYYNSIPNIIHYVYLKQNATSTIDFHFAHFLSLYAAETHVSPTKVYIHTDYNETEINEAKEKGSKWTHRVMNTFPDLLEWHPVRVPSFAGTNENAKVTAIQHKSDFLRWETIAPIGGIYMDWDVIALRPLKPLMTAGFAFVAGRQMHIDPQDNDGSKGEMNNGIFMTRSNSLMSRIMSREQNANFNGDWSDNLKFMTRVAERLVAIPGEVLICDRNAFNPMTWHEEAKKELFLPHEEASPEPVVTGSRDPMVRYESAIANRRVRREWEWDLSSTYTLHAFGQTHYNEFITPKKILARTSNYGVAVWPTVKKMVVDGVIDGTEDTCCDSRLELNFLRTLTHDSPVTDPNLAHTDEIMTQYNEILASLEGLRHDGLYPICSFSTLPALHMEYTDRTSRTDSGTDPTQVERVLSVSSTQADDGGSDFEDYPGYMGNNDVEMDGTFDLENHAFYDRPSISACAAFVQEHPWLFTPAEETDANNVDNPSSATPKTNQEDVADDFYETNPDPKKIWTYNITNPEPKIVLPPNYPFRTTEKGYTIYRPRPQKPRRASMTTAQGFEDPRVTAFISHWTEHYEAIGNHSFSRAEGFFQLQLACQVRGLVSYGRMDQLVVRLVDRALRDAARGWSEISDKVGRVKVEEPPAAVAVIAEGGEDMSDAEPWWAGLSYGG